jgi:hypothetical protein
MIVDSNLKSEEKEEIRSLLRAINRAWVEGQPEKLNDYFHEDMVIAQPGGPVYGRGKKKSVESYKDFLSRANIIKFKDAEPQIEIWDNTAVASYSFELTYTLDGKELNDSGVDLFIFSRRGDRWLAVWRALLPLPENPTSS